MFVFLTLKLRILTTVLVRSMSAITVLSSRLSLAAASVKRKISELGGAPVKASYERKRGSKLHSSLTFFT